MNQTSLFSLDTEFTACSTEFSPITQGESILACGTYQLVQGDLTVNSDSVQKRIGKLLLYKLKTDPSPRLIVQ